jgi:hypothetical protein
MGDWRNGLPMSAAMFLSRALESSNGGAWNGSEARFYSYSETLEFTRGANAGGSSSNGNSIFRTIGSFFKRLFGGKNQILNRLNSVNEFAEYVRTKGSVVVGLRIYGGDILILPTEGYDKKGKKVANDGWNWSISMVKTRTREVGITFNDGERVRRTRLEVKVDGAWHGVTELLLSVPDVSSMDRYGWFDSKNFGFEPQAIEKANDFGVNYLWIFIDKPKFNWPEMVPRTFRMYPIRGSSWGNRDE